MVLSVFFFNDAPPAEIYTRSLHDALPISRTPRSVTVPSVPHTAARRLHAVTGDPYSSTALFTKLISPTTTPLLLTAAALLDSPPWPSWQAVSGMASWKTDTSPTIAV